jgi:uncharacterized Fe-S cluster-containing radical SAM superfamily protein
MLRILLDNIRILFYIYFMRGRVPSGQYYTTIIELTSICNLSCPLCPVAKGNNILEREQRLINPDDFNRIVELTLPYTKSYTLGMWGEPLLNPLFFDYYEKVKERKVWVSTNLNYNEDIAHRLAECENLNIICSIDGWDKYSYETNYRLGGNYDVMLRNLKILSAGKCTIWPQFLINERNQHDTQNIYDFMGSLGIDKKQVVLKPMIENIKNDGTKKIEGVCHYMHQAFYFNTDGHLVPCCINVGKDMNIAHIADFGTSKELLNGSVITKVRDILASDKTKFTSCATCGQNKNYATDLLQTIKRKIKTVVLNIAGQN